jgi:chaperonin GroES
MKIRPLHDRVAVQRSNPEKTSKGGIIIPDAAQEQVTDGIVLAIGTGRLLHDGSVRPLDVKVGDKVICAKYGGQEVTVNGEKIVLFHEDELAGVLES